MNQITTSLLEKIEAWTAAVMVLVMPVFFLTTTANFYDLNKQILLLIGTILLLAIFALRAFMAKTVSLRKSPFTIPLLLFMAVVIISSTFAAPNRIAAWVTPLGATSIICLTIFALLITQMSDASKKLIASSLTFSGIVLSLVIFQQFVGVAKTILPKVPFLQDTAWTPSGSLYSSFVYLVAVITISFPKIMLLYKKDKTMATALYVFGIIVMTIAAVISLYQITALKKAVFLPQSVGWYIALDSLKNRLLLGYGPGNFLTAFTATRPLSFNQFEFWNLRFITSSNLYFHIWTTLGIAGLATFVSFVLVVIRHFRSSPFSFHKNTLPLVLVLVLGLIFPPAFLFLFLLYVLAGLHSAEYEHVTQKLTGQFQAVLLIPLLFLGYVFYQGTRVYAAEMHFKNAADALSLNQAQKTYEEHRLAIAQAPWRDTYRLSLSQVNMVLANAIAKNPNLTDQDRATLSQLIQQSIQEAKNAVSLNPTHVTNWENLARIYRQLLNIAKGADQWTVASYLQAINLDPYNPLLRIELGGVFYAAQNYDEAVRQFDTAARLKPDLANAHYNLAAAFAKQQNYQRAIAEMEAVVRLVPADSKDAEIAKQELEELKKNAASATPGNASGESLTNPQPDTPIVNPPLELPEDAAPPATESAQTVEPSPSASPSSSASGTPQPSSSNSPTPSTS
ncbi:tetratricopeptide repeat protein [Candidatus Microgenomates bacterium]|nr:MAG: tetratricopeptide repeat protein [Candidatus Microgenomates bacterium]